MFVFYDTVSEKVKLFNSLALPTWFSKTCVWRILYCKPWVGGKNCNFFLPIPCNFLGGVFHALATEVITCLPKCFITPDSGVLVVSFLLFMCQTISIMSFTVSLLCSIKCWIDNHPKVMLRIAYTANSVQSSQRASSFKNWSIHGAADMNVLILLAVTVFARV